MNTNVLNSLSSKRIELALMFSVLVLIFLGDQVKTFLLDEHVTGFVALLALATFIFGMINESRGKIYAAIGFFGALFFVGFALVFLIQHSDLFPYIWKAAQT